MVTKPEIKTRKATIMLHTDDTIIKHKVGLLNLADELGNIAKACKMMGVSRGSFYLYKETVGDEGEEALLVWDAYRSNQIWTTTE